MPGASRRRNVRLLLFVSSAVLLVMQLPGYFAQNKNRDWQSEFSVSQSELTWLSASMLLEHHRLQEALRQYASVPEESGRVDLQRHLRAYTSRFEKLDELIDGHLQQLEQLDGLKDQPDIESGAFELSVNNLQASGLPTLRRIEKRVADLQPRDYTDLFATYDELGELGAQVTRFLMDGFEFSRQLNADQVELTDRLNQRLWFSQFGIVYGMLLFGIALIVYLRERQSSARMLERTNERLESEIEESRRLTRELERRASRDGLSGLLNRHGFDRELERVLSGGTGRHGLCFLDIDMFKIVNDTSGHTAGDALITVVADLLKRRIGEDGTVARFGGDEFLIMMEYCDKSRFERTILDLCEELRLLRFDHHGQPFDVGVSFGAVHFEASGQSVQSLMAIVDTECHEAKRAGGARVRFHGDDGIVEAKRNDIRLVGDIHRALGDGRFRLFRQPIHSLRADGSGSLHGWEVLLRMVGENGESVPPQVILNVAERYSFAPKIDRWVVTQAFDWLNGRPEELEHVDCLNINLSGCSVGDREFLRFLEQQTSRLSIDTSRVCFEITETAAAGDCAREFILRLKELGYQLALDDFGTGFSSFGYLESLPVDYIKIDGLFVRDIDTNRTHREFVKAISVVGRAMGKAVVAEFVSNDESARVLGEMGIDYAQGYHLGHPSPLSVDAARSGDGSETAGNESCQHRRIQVA